LKKIIAYVLFFVGVLLLAGAGLYAWHTLGPQPGVTAGVEAPATVAGFSLVRTQTGDAAIAAIRQLQGVDYPLSSGIVAEYGQKSATLWLAETGSDAQALELIRNLEGSLAQAGAFTPMGVFQFQNRDVYVLNGADGLTNFYAQSGRKVFWLAIAPEEAELAMKELLAFYP